MREQRQLQLLVCSANLGNAIPDCDSLAAWIPDDGCCVEVFKSPPKYPVRTNPLEPEPPAISFANYEETDQFDLIVVGMQEATFDPPKYPEGEETVVRIQVPVVQPLVRKGVKKTLGTVSNLTANRDHTKQSRLSQLNINMDDWDGGTTVLHSLLESQLPSYKRIVSYQRGQMRLEVFAHCENVEIEVLNVAAQNTGRAGLANKGGIVAELVVNGQTRLAFLTAHLEAHEGASKYQIRCNTLGDIFSGTKAKLHDFSLSSHFAFVMGDLNFRTELPDSTDLSEEEHKERVREMVAKEDWQGLNDADELHRALRQKECLVGFQTCFCNFPPTFKVERQAGYTYIDKRRPSYTDRVLWKTNHGLQGNARPLIYEPIDDFATSDHKPIRAAFAVDLNEPFRMRPKMARHRSMKHLGQLLHSRQKRSVPGTVAHKEKLYLFVSQISCEITRKRDLSPDSYILLTSTPVEALKQQMSKWNRWKSRILCRSIAIENTEDGKKAKTASGWPRSSRKSGTNTFCWGEADIHCEIKAHTPDGSPVDLTGAMLRLSLMGYNPSSDDTILGTFCFNLVNLIRSCRKLDGSSQLSENAGRRRSGRSLFRRSGASTSTNRDHDNVDQIQLVDTDERLLHFGRDASPATSRDHDNLDQIQSVDIDEPLLKNGRETGRIKCTIETWWMDPQTARILASGQDQDSGSIGSDRKVMLSDRHPVRMSSERRGRSARESF